MNNRILEIIRSKLGDALTIEFPPLIRREATVPAIKGKSHAVIGMRRAGKTSYLLQTLADRLSAGVERERLIYFNFEDERLSGLEARDLGMVIEEYYRDYPHLRGTVQVTWCFDEIQVVPGWEQFVRRLLDSENVEVFISGSSARMLSREVATSMRGRATETVITPYNFREFIRSQGHADTRYSKRLLSARDRSQLRALFDDYLEIGGFPEAGVVDAVRDRIDLLQGYVDTVIFRDVAERHSVGNLPALRAFVRQLLRSPACPLSVNKTYLDFKSRGLPVSKETLFAYLDHLEDAFLVSTVALATRSERRKQVNPRKLYLADHALATAFSPASGLDRGHLIENIVACELSRQCRDLSYVRTKEGLEVDFLATDFDGGRRLVQVASDISSSATVQRETNALLKAAEAFPDATLWLIAENDLPDQVQRPPQIHYEPVWLWLARAPHAAGRQSRS